MFTEQEKQTIKNNMKKQELNCAVLGRRWGCSRQNVNATLNGAITNKEVERKLREFLNE